MSSATTASISVKSQSWVSWDADKKKYDYSAGFTVEVSPEVEGAQKVAKGILYAFSRSAELVHYRWTLYKGDPTTEDDQRKYWSRNIDDLGTQWKRYFTPIDPSLCDVKHVSEAPDSAISDGQVWYHSKQGGKLGDGMLKHLLSFSRSGIDGLHSIVRCEMPNLDRSEAQDGFLNATKHADHLKELPIVAIGAIMQIDALESLGNDSD